MKEREFDLVIIGSGPAGEKAAIEASRMRKSTAIVERHSVQGGVCIHTGTIPSKTLRETAVYISGLRQRSAYGLMGGVRQDITIQQLMYRKDQVIRQELDIIQENMARHRIEVIHGLGKLINPHTVEVTDREGQSIRLQAEVIIISTGARPIHPDELDFESNYIYDGETIINLDVIPRSLTIVGAGVIGCEYASIFAHIGVKVTVVDERERLMPFLDPEISDALTYLMRKYRINLILGDGVDDITIADDQVVTVTRSGRRVVSDRLLYAAGRTGNTESLGLDALGIITDERGIISVDELYRTSVPNIFAVGDVIGFPSLASVSADQGRLAAIHAFKEGDTSCINTLLPFGIYTIPEVSMVGETEATLTAAGQEYEIGVAHYFELARGQIINDHDGFLKLLFEPTSRRLLGVHCVGERATEMIHIGQAVMTLDGRLDYFVNTVFNYPTLSEAYKVAAMDGFARLNNSG